MINPKELMIGNTVLLQDNKTEVMISQIDNRSNLIEVELPDGSLILRKKGLLHPIPLTPSILERCGWVKHYNPEKDHTTEYWDYLDVALIVYSGVIRLQQHGTVIEHLHHLQNIVKNLTGKELEVK